jgi:transposase, IS5 family
LKKNKSVMLGPSPHQGQADLFKHLLAHQLNPKHSLYLLARVIPWKKLEESFASLYARVGFPSHPIRKMASLWMRKHRYHLSDERVVAMWQESLYDQYLAGEATFQWGPPCTASDGVHLRHRLEEDGITKLFALAVALHADKVKKAKEVMGDTTVQEKNIPFPTEAKRYKKVIQQCPILAQRGGMKLRQSYRWVVRRLEYAQGDAHLARHAKKAKRAPKKLSALAGRQVRDLRRQLIKWGQKERYTPMLPIIERMVRPKRGDQRQVYSLHEPEVSCIAKGKAHKQDELGSQVSVASWSGGHLVVGIVNFAGNPHDSKILAPTLDPVAQWTGRHCACVLIDTDYRGHAHVGGAAVMIPGKKVHASADALRRHQTLCKRRSEIEAILGYLKSDHSMGSNYLRGRAGDVHHALLAGLGFNLMLLLRAWAGHSWAVMLWAFFSLIPSRPLRLAQNYTGS